MNFVVGFDTEVIEGELWYVAIISQRLEDGVFVVLCDPAYGRTKQRALAFALQKVANSILEEVDGK